MNTADLDERDALAMKRLAAGGDAALNELLDRHAEKLFHFFILNLHNEADAADLAQETFVRVYQHRARFDPAQRFSTWLYAIASNLVKDRHRWRARHPQVSLDAENQPDGGTLGDRLPEGNPPPNDRLQAEERIEAVRRAINALPVELRLPLILVEYEERSYEEIAKILRCSAKAVETRIYRARRQLRSSLASVLEET